MAVPLIYNLRSLRQRPVSTLTTALGMALVVAVFIGLMALSNGFRAALAQTGSPDNVIVLRQGADSELTSGLEREKADILSALPFVARDGAGRPLVSPELYVVINLDRPDGGLANVVVRGVSPQAFEVRRGVRIVDGRMFRPGSPEILVGKKISNRFANVGVGDRIRFGDREWTVVGHFTAGGSAFESEIWGENEQVLPAFRRGNVFQSVTLRMQDPEDFKGVESALESDRRLRVDAHQEQDFYTKQSGMLTSMLNFVAVFVTAIMGVGAVFGAVNTMYAAVAARAPEIAVLRTIGFRPRSILMSFVAEALLIALLGGIVGCLIALPINGIVTSTTNWSSFSEVAFAFRVTPKVLAWALGFALVMGLIGGFFPALRAARLPISQALRQV